VGGFYNILSGKYQRNHTTFLFSFLTMYGCTNTQCSGFLITHSYTGGATCTHKANDVLKQMLPDNRMYLISSGLEFVLSVIYTVASDENI